VVSGAPHPRRQREAVRRARVVVDAPVDACARPSASAARSPAHPRTESRPSSL
jgi:hypothetical protein